MKKWVALLCLGLLAGCAADTDVPDMPAEKLYTKALTQFEKTDYEGAAKYFDEIERQHPYSVWAPRAQIMAAYAFYKKNEYDDAILALDRFIQLHPGNKNTPYAYYLKGLCYYEQMSDIAREQQMTEDAKQTFSDLVARYPNTAYAIDARAKLNMIEDHLAGKEMAVGRYYLHDKDYLAAMNRFQIVTDKFATTNQVNEAYYRLAVCYISLGMYDQARRMDQLQKSKYAGTKWTQKTTKLVSKYQPPKKKAKK